MVVRVTCVQDHERSHHVVRPVYGSHGRRTLFDRSRQFRLVASSARRGRVRGRNGSSHRTQIQRRRLLVVVRSFGDPAALAQPRLDVGPRDFAGNAKLQAVREDDGHADHDLDRFGEPFILYTTNKYKR